MTTYYSDTLQRRVTVPDPYLDWCAEVGEWLHRAGTPFVHGLADMLRDLYDRDFEPQEAAAVVAEKML